MLLQNLHTEDDDIVAYKNTIIKKEQTINNMLKEKPG